MSERRAGRYWVPPQRLPDESQQHYLDVLARKMNAWRLIRDDHRNGRDLRKKARHRYDVCVAARDKELTR